MERKNKFHEFHTTELLYKSGTRMYKIVFVQDVNEIMLKRRYDDAEMVLESAELQT